MNVLAWFSLLNVLLFLMVGYKVSELLPKGTIRKIFNALSILFAYSAFSEFMVRQAESPETAKLWLQLGGLWPLLYPLFLHFTWTVLHPQKSKKWKWAFVLSYATGLVLSVLDWILHYTGPVTTKKPWGFELHYTIQHGFFFWFLVSWSGVLLGLAIYPSLKSAFQKQEISKKRQAQFLTIGMAFPLVFGGVDLVFMLMKISFPSLFKLSLLWTAFFFALGLLHNPSFLLDPEKVSYNILETIPDPLLILNHKTDIIKANRAISTLLGYAPGELQGKSIAHLLFGSKYMPKDFEQRLLSENIVNMDFDLPHKDGQILTILFSSSILLDRGSRLLGVSCLLRDISPQRKIELELRKSQEDFHNIVQRNPDGILVLGAGNRILFGNRIGKRWFEEFPTLHPGYQTGIFDSVKTYNFEFGKTPEDFRAFELWSINTEWEGVPAQLISVRDVTDRRKAERKQKRVEEQLIQAQKMEAIGTLAGGIAHDFNNLLTAIMGTAELAKFDTEQTHPAYESLDEIKQFSEQAAGLTRRLLLFSRRQSVGHKKFELNKTVEELMKMLHRLIGEHIVISTELEPNLWSLFGEPGSLEQVIMNLALNARDAMPDGGTILIKTENILLQNEESARKDHQGEYVKITISDTGKGIPEEARSHIFEPFFTTKERGKGTGLGLAVAYGIIEQHGGWITFESETDLGTTFEIYLPVMRKLAPAPEAEPQTYTPREKKKALRLLLVEDQEGVRDFVEKTLKKSGFTVFAAEDATQAIEIFEQEKADFDLVLSDVILPDKNGLELIDRLHETKPELPVLLASGYLDNRSQKETIERRQFPFLRKPFSVETLLKAIDKLGL